MNNTFSYLIGLIVLIAIIGAGYFYILRKKRLFGRDRRARHRYAGRRYNHHPNRYGFKL